MRFLVIHPPPQKRQGINSCHIEPGFVNIDGIDASVIVTTFFVQSNAKLAVRLSAGIFSIPHFTLVGSLAVAKEKDTTVI